MPFDPRVVATVDAARPGFEAIGCRTEEAFPDLSDARDIFLTLRARGFAQAYGELLDAHRERIKATVIWNIEQGRMLREEDLTRVAREREASRTRVEAFFSRFAFLALPVSQVPPFDVDLEYPTEVEGVAMPTYLDWMASCWVITVTGHPAISVPCGFTEDGLPVGVQIVGRRGADLDVLRLAHAFERALGAGLRRPPGA